MPTDLIEVREYVLEAVEGAYVYALTDATLHADLKAAHLWVARQIRVGGTGRDVPVEGGMLPSRAWTTVKVRAADFEVSVGDAENLVTPDDAYQGIDPEYDEQIERIRQSFENDEPLPPDE